MVERQCVKLEIWGSDPFFRQKFFSLMELLFNPCGEFLWSPEGSASQIYSPHLHVAALGTFRSFKICTDAKERVGCGKQREATVPIQSLVKLQLWFLSLRWKTCLRQNCSLGSCACSEGPALGQNTLMMMMMMMMMKMMMVMMPVNSSE